MIATTDPRERLTLAAAKLIHQQGFARTTLADIAKAAKVALGSVYYYFRSKDEIAAAIVAKRVADIDRLLLKKSTLPDPRSRLQGLVQVWVEDRDIDAEYGCPIGSLCYELAKGRVPAGYLVGVPPRGRASAPRPAGGEPRRSLVRTAIALLLAQPALADEATAELPWLETLELPGVPLLVELLRAIGERRPPNTGALLEAFAAHPQAEALRKLAALPLPGEPAALAADFRGALRQLRRRAIDQRLDWLKAQPALDEAGRAELRALLADRE